MIIGTGIDIVEIKRFQKLNNKNDFVRQFLTEKEINTVNGKYLKDEFYAMLFATKEAILKALGCGLEYGSYWHNIEINNHEKPVLSGFVKNFAKKKSVSDIHISYAHSKEYAMGVAVVEESVSGDQNISRQDIRKSEYQEQKREHNGKAEKCNW